MGHYGSGQPAGPGIPNTSGGMNASNGAAAGAAAAGAAAAKSTEPFWSRYATRTPRGGAARRADGASRGARNRLLAEHMPASRARANHHHTGLSSATQRVPEAPAEGLDAELPRTLTHPPPSLACASRANAPRDGAPPARASSSHACAQLGPDVPPPLGRGPEDGRQVDLRPAAPGQVVQDAQEAADARCEMRPACGCVGGCRRRMSERMVVRLASRQSTLRVDRPC